MSPKRPPDREPSPTSGAGGSRAPLRIGQLASETGVTNRTIRYYEQLGILPEAHRSPGGVRRYTREDRKILERVLALKKLGFSLADIKTLAPLIRGELSRSGSAEAAKLLEGARKELEHQTRLLRRLEAAWA